MVEVRVTGAGVVRGDVVQPDAATQAHCSLCDRDVDLAVQLAGVDFACRDCLRIRLDASSVANWRLREPSGGGLPWGEVAG